MSSDMSQQCTMLEDILYTGQYIVIFKKNFMQTILKSSQKMSESKLFNSLEKVSVLGNSFIYCVCVCVYPFTR